MCLFKLLLLLIIYDNFDCIKIVQTDIFRYCHKKYVKHKSFLILFLQIKLVDLNLIILDFSFLVLDFNFFV